MSALATFLLAIGLVLSLEGLILALAARRIEELLALMAALGVEARRRIGLVALALGLGLVWLSERLAGG